MKQLISRTSQGMGALTKIREKYKDKHEVLIDAFVKACIIVIDNYTATKLIRAGIGSGWKFLCGDDNHVELWMPQKGIEPVSKYIVRNAILWRAVAARGRGLITQEE